MNSPPAGDPTNALATSGQDPVTRKTDIMQSEESCYIDSGSYARGDRKYKKQRSFWHNIRFAGLMIFVLGGTIIVGSSLLKPVMLTIMNAGAALSLLGIIMTLAGRTVIRRHKLDDFPYRLAHHYMDEMGIDNPKERLDTNPRYVEAVEEVRVAITALEGKHKGTANWSHGLTANACRIGSLVLRDQRSLDLTPHLINLIEERELSDYDSLATLFDAHDNHHTILTDGIL